MSAMVHSAFGRTPLHRPDAGALRIWQQLIHSRSLAAHGMHSASPHEKVLLPTLQNAWSAMQTCKRYVPATASAHSTVESSTIHRLSVPDKTRHQS